MLINTNTMNEPAKSVTPFLKWAGGKRWLAQTLAQQIGTITGRYIEPFLGGGSVFFALQPESAILGDLNEDLVNAYQSIKLNWESIQEKLAEHQSLHSKEHYYEVRSEIPKDRYDRAARFIYLNRTCWNGLYRVNLSGDFNVPIGTKDKVILESDDFKKVSDLLSRAEIVTSDFESLINRATEGDVVFADPPYTVRHKYNGFVKYNEHLFSWSDQIRLRDAMLRAADRGARVFVTNADHESVKSLYSARFKLSGVERYSSISGNSGNRGKYSELVITG